MSKSILEIINEKFGKSNLVKFNPKISWKSYAFRRKSHYIKSYNEDISK